MAFIDHFPNRSSNAILSELMDWQTEVLSKITSKLSPTEAKKVTMSGSLPIHMLPFDEQVNAMKRFRSIIGFDTVLNSLSSSTRSFDDRINDIFAGMRTITPRGESSPFLRFPNQSSGNRVLDYIYQSLNVNFDEKVRHVRSGLKNLSNSTPASHFGIGVNSIPMITPDLLGMSSSLRTGASYMAFDIETAGLLGNQIREVAYGMGTVGSRGHTITETGQTLFRPRLFARGTRGMRDPVTGRVGSLGLEDFMQGKYGLKLADLPTEKLGADFAERMTPFLNRILEVDHVIGHNIIGFDIPQIFQSLVGTDAYKRDASFAKLVDDAYSSIKSKTVDTLILARQAPNLSGLQTAGELLGTDSKSIYSIENLLLETDLAERIGIRRLRAAMAGKGLHFGDVDTMVTMGLVEHLNDLQVKRLGGTQATDSIRRQIISSAAVTPTTKIRDVNEISDVVLKHLIKVDNGIDSSKASRNLRNLLKKAAGGDEAAAEAAFEKIRQGKARRLNYNISPVEHQAIETRNLSMGLGRSVSSDNLVFGNNLFDQAVYGRSGEGVPYSAGVAGQARLSADEFAQLQGRLAKRGMPWAGASLEERSLGTSLSHVTSSLLPQNGIKSLISDTMISTFKGFDPHTIQFTTASGRPTLPAYLLDQAGVLRSDNGTMLRLSQVERTFGNPDTSFNLVYQFRNGDERENLAKYVEDLIGKDDDVIVAALGYNSTSVEEEAQIVSRFRKAVTEDNLPGVIRGLDLQQGVTIAQLTGDEANNALGVLTNFHGMPSLRDDRIIPVGLPYMGVHDNTVQTTGALLTSHLSQEELDLIPRQVEQAKAGYRAYIELGKSGDKSMLARQVINISDSKEAAIRKVYEGYQTVRKHVGKGILGLVGAAALFEGFKKYRENRQYNVVMDQMPAREGHYAVADILQAQIASGIDKSYQRYDPLSTAFTVRELDANKINHTNMSWDKNNSLYGGVL